jgi:hypothetical protein
MPPLCDVAQRFILAYMYGTVRTCRAYGTVQHVHARASSNVLQRLHMADAAATQQQHARGTYKRSERDTRGNLKCTTTLKCTASMSCVQGSYDC